MGSGCEQAGRDLGIGKACWGAVAALAVDRAAASARLTTCFRLGEAPEAVDGHVAGHFLTTTFGAGVDQLLAPLARMWMPWKGKVFDASSATGWNWFADSALRLMRLAYPAHPHVTADLPGTFKAFRFRTERRASALVPDVSVLRVDYDLPENPSWPFRRLTDELVRIGHDIYLGQALMRGARGPLRVAWFALEADESNR